jgi:hypothetical protein
MTVGPSTDTAYSVCYRTGPLTDADYDEAIEALRNAKEHDQSKGCTVCSDSGHGAETCHHNPLVLARRWARATSVWVCWHCGFEATNAEDARAHFGLGEEHEPKCLSLLSRQVEELRKALERARPLMCSCDNQNEELDLARSVIDVLLSSTKPETEKQ